MQPIVTWYTKIAAKVGYGFFYLGWCKFALRLAYVYVILYLVYFVLSVVMKRTANRSFSLIHNFKKLQNLLSNSQNWLPFSLILWVWFQVRQVQIPHASVGPEEPHAASTAWPDGVTEKQGFDLLDSEVDRAEFEKFLRFELPSHPKLHRGQLKNGLRYLILPNKVPPNRYYSLARTVGL